MKYKLSNIIFSSSDLQDILNLIKTVEYEMTFYQESSELSSIQNNILNLPKVKRGYTLQFTSLDSTEILPQFYNKDIKSINLICAEFCINYNIGINLDFLIRVANDSIQEAIDDSIEKILNLKEAGANFGFMDKAHILKVMSIFFNNNLYHSSVEHWQCTLRDFTAIKPGNMWDKKEIDGKIIYSLANFNLSLLKPWQLVTHKQIEQYVAPLIIQLNKSTNCTIHSSEITAIQKLHLQSSTEFNFNSSIETVIDINKLYKFVNEETVLNYWIENSDDKASICFRSLEIDNRIETKGIFIYFDDDSQRDKFIHETSNKFQLIVSEE